MNRSSRDRSGCDQNERRNPSGWQIPLFARKRNRSSTFSEESSSSDDTRREPSRKKSRSSVVRDPPARQEPEIEEIDIIELSSDSEDESVSESKVSATNAAATQKKESVEANTTKNSNKEDTDSSPTDNNEEEAASCTNDNRDAAETSVANDNRDQDSDTSIADSSDENADSSPVNDNTTEDADTSVAESIDEEVDNFVAQNNNNSNNNGDNGPGPPAPDKCDLFFQSHCWVCHVQLVSDDEHVCCYAMHTHPLLNTPLCSVCYESLKDAIKDRSACSGCGEETETSFLCDNVVQSLVCQNEFCFECVEKAGLDPAVLQASADEWHCLACKPTPILQALSVSDPTAAALSERAIEEILQELKVAEEKKKECEEALEDANVQLRYQEILHELKETVPDSELGEAVLEELNTWEELQLRHDARLGDFIARLQDELEGRGLDLATVYYSEDYFSLPTPTLPDVAPDWVQAADRVVDQRRPERIESMTGDVLPDKEYKKDYSDYIVEIAAIDAMPDVEGCKGTGWTAKFFPKPTLDDLRVILDQENRALRKNRVTVKRQAETKDKDIMKAEGPIIRRKNGKMVVEHTKQRARFRTSNKSTTLSQTNKTNIRSKQKDTPSNVNLLSQESEIVSMSEVDGPFLDSEDVLCTPSSREGSFRGLKTEGVVRKVSIAQGFARILKQHQKDGVKFIWGNTFCDFETNYNGDANDERVGGCILAHHMGLGKTLTAIALLHTVLTHPSMISPQNDKKLLRTVVLVVPVNTLANWAEEFTKWLEYVSPRLCVYTPFNMEIHARRALIDKWMATGGIFLVSKDTLSNLAVVNGKETDLLHADILVLDEAHSMIKNPSTQIFTALSKFTTKRRILLSGSPFQNNLEEYYHICNFIREGVFGALHQFKKEFIDPILQGQAKDSTRHQKALIATRSADLRKLVDAHVHRKDLSILENDLPKLSQVVVHVRPSHIQSKIYRTFEKARKSNPELRGFFKMYSELSPVHNHPSCLLKYSAAEDTNFISKVWCRKHLTLKSETVELEKITGGNKIVLLLHLLAYAEVLGEKVLIFSQYIPTLNYIESVLNSGDWISQVPSLSCFSGQRLGAWEKGRHYLRIDGSSSSAQRGQWINAFNKDGADGDLRAFLISTEAGSLGINLTSASRIVLVDSHFNPTVMAQAVFRAYRYGQQKPVHCYRLLTEGTMEEKIYKRSVNKTGLALRIIDSKAIDGFFTAKELEDFQESQLWVQCDKCDKWRMLFGESEEDLPEKWFCEMNTDEHNNKCELPERDQTWYFDFFKNGLPASPQKPKTKMEQPKCQPEEEDELLSHLLSISENKKDTSLISRHYYHDSLLQSRHDGEEVEHARILLASAAVDKDRSCDASATPVEAVPSLVSLQAGEAAANDHSSKDSGAPRATSSRVLSAAEAIESDQAVASALSESSEMFINEISFPGKKQNTAKGKDFKCELLDEKPMRQSLSRSSEIINLCDSSDDDA